MRLFAETLVGPDYKIKQKMQAKLNVSIFILGLDDILGPPPAGANAMEILGKVGHLSPKAGDKCIMIRGSERKVHDASKVIIHILVERCYEGKDKDTLKRSLRVVRQVRKKAKPSSPSKAKTSRQIVTSPAAAAPAPPRHQSNEDEPTTMTPGTDGATAAATSFQRTDTSSLKAISSTSAAVPSATGPPLPEKGTPHEKKKSFSYLSLATELQPDQITGGNSSLSYSGTSSRVAPPPGMSLIMNEPTFSTAAGAWICKVRSPPGFDWKSLFQCHHGQKKQWAQLFPRCAFTVRGPGIRNSDGSTGGADSILCVEIDCRGDGFENKNIVANAANYVARVLIEECPQRQRQHGQRQLAQHRQPQSQHQPPRHQPPHRSTKHRSNQGECRNQRDLPRGCQRPPRAELVGSGSRAHWTATVWPPVDDYPSYDFLVRFRELQMDLEHRFRVEIRPWGKQGYQQEPLHFGINGQTSVAVENCAEHITRAIVPTPRNSGTGNTRDTRWR